MTQLSASALPNTAPVVRDLALWRPDQAEAIAERVLALREHWTPRHPGVPFYTLGAASYLDGEKGQDERYLAHARLTNPVLRTNFAEALEHFRASVELTLGQRCFYDERVALPGFHVYLSDPQFVQRMGSIHIDLQFENVRWTELGYEAIDFDRQLSLTAAIELPRSGGGLKVWPVDGQALRGADPDTRAAILAKQPKACLHPYRVGHLALHSGFLFHQIAPIATLHPHDRRITLQAHALPIGDGWLLYW